MSQFLFSKETIIPNAPWMNCINDIFAASDRYGVPADLICAIGMKESGWNHSAIRYEPNFYRWLYNPLNPRVTNSKIKQEVPEINRGLVSLETEKHSRAFSWGAMQVMGQVARERGFDGPFLSALSVPKIGIDYGVKYLAWQFKRYENDESKTASAFNAGSATQQNQDNYVQPVLEFLNAIRSQEFEKYLN